MKKLISGFILVTTLLISCLLYLPAYANLITNGSFESGLQSPQIIGYNLGDTLPNWTVSVGDIERINKDFWQASDGNWSLDLNGVSVGGIEQSFITTPGSIYLVSFDLSANYYTQGIYTMDVNAVGAATKSASYSFDNSGANASDMKWADETFQFTADSSLTTLQFVSTSTFSSSRGPALDNVEVERTGKSAVPEPATLSLLGLGLFGLLARRKK